MITYNERRYWTLDDVRHDIALFPNSEGPFLMEFNALGMDEFIENVIIKCGWQTPANWTSSNYLNKCWQNYIWPKFYDKPICYSDDDSIADNDSEKVFANFVGPIIAWMLSSDTKFSLLIANQEANKDKLLGQIKASTTSRFNDTPQNGGNFSDDNHTTTITTGESSTDGGTLLSRLNEIEDNLKRLYDDWSNEFRKFIIWSGVGNE